MRRRPSNHIPLKPEYFNSKLPEHSKSDVNGLKSSNISNDSSIAEIFQSHSSNSIKDLFENTTSKTENPDKQIESQQNTNSNTENKNDTDLFAVKQINFKRNFIFANNNKLMKLFGPQLPEENSKVKVTIQKNSAEESASKVVQQIEEKPKTEVPFSQQKTADEELEQFDFNKLFVSEGEKIVLDNYFGKKQKRITEEWKPAYLVKKRFCEYVTAEDVNG